MRAHVAVSRIIAIASILLLLPLTALAQSATPSTGNASANVDWPYYGNDIGAMHYQNLDQINPSNVSQLQPAWILHTGVAMNNGASFENQPIVTDGMMFVSTGHDQVLALDPATGAIKWTYDPTDLPPINDLPICCGQDNRGVAVGDGKVFIARLDATLVALDEQTGKVLWNTPVADWHSGYAETMAPLYIDNEVIVGSSGAEMEVRGFVAAYDAKTGQQLWRFLTVPGPGHVGHDTWAGNSWLTGGA
ncbi:MAG TPA: PQQ-binding-like beta-propeller repeat protein, partial [Thermomicrobiales bacterium]|nr:PQQ-binding-like beta-propeller repeat protein [Thermomicrobiales bacterium]